MNDNLSQDQKDIIEERFRAFISDLLDEFKIKASNDLEYDVSLDLAESNLNEMIADYINAIINANQL